MDTYTSAVESNDGCCATSCGCGVEDVPAMAEDYTQLDGYVAEADLQLGCGIPIEAAQLKQGDTVIDLGSGAGNDAFIIRRLVGETGYVYGIDFTQAMLQKAIANTAKMGYTNVSFLYGDIEDVPLKDHIADVVVSNCVMNLVPEKKKAYAETYRLLKTGGHIAISDIVSYGLPEAFLNDAALYAGCVSGAIHEKDYLEIVSQSGFKNLAIVKSKPIRLPAEVFEKHGLTPQESGVKSITLYAEK